MRDTGRSLATRVAALAALALALAGCTEHPREAARGFTAAPTTVLRSSTGAPLVLACPMMPRVTKRAVAVGSPGDENRNGVVCDQRIGGPSAARERVLTTDDVLTPAAAARN